VPVIVSGGTFQGMKKEKEKQTVLIVDDEPLIRISARQILEDAGHEVKEASNADDALSLTAADGITVLLTDIDMPGSMEPTYTQEDSESEDHSNHT
jgi:DNA-binding NtrC family response regulator